MTISSRFTGGDSSYLMEGTFPFAGLRRSRARFLSSAVLLLPLELLHQTDFPRVTVHVPVSV